MTADEYNSNSNATEDYYKKDLQNFGEQFQAELNIFSKL